MSYNPLLTEKVIQDALNKQKTEQILTPELIRLEKIPVTMDEKKIDDIFDNKNHQHQLCKSDDQWTRKEYHKIFKVCKFIADHIEHNNTEDDNLAHDHAYKMVVAFADSPNKKYIDTLKNYRDFLHNSELDTGDNPVHDSFAAFSLPTEGNNVTLGKWQELIKVKGLKAMRLFARADEIEKKKAELQGKTGHIRYKGSSRNKNKADI